MSKRIGLMLAGGAWVLLLLAGGAWAQAAYPERPIKLIVPLPPGSPVDVVGRRMGEIMSPSLGVPVIVDNKPGAALTIGAAEVARAAPDGYTLLLTVAEPLVSAPAVIKIRYDPQRDFKLISKIAASTSGSVLIASSKVKANNLAELISEARSAAAPLTYASFGPGSYPQQILETLSKQAGVKFTEVPYKGSPPAFTDLLAGHLALSFSSVDQAAASVTAGKIKAIAIMDKSATLPQVQTFAEGGFNSLVFRNKPWIGLAGPAAMPEAIVQRLSAAVRVAANDPGFRKFLAGIGFDAIGNTPAQFLEEYRAEMAVIPGLIRDLGVVPE